MKHNAPLLALLLSLGLALPAQAADCFADYKAKQDDPLKLHYGVVRLSDGACPSAGAAARQISSRLAGSGWQLLTVLTVSSTPPTVEQKNNAGRFYLRY